MTQGVWPPVCQCAPGTVPGTPVHFEAADCLQSAQGHLQSSSTFPKYPHTGQVFKVTHHYVFDHPVTAGEFQVKVHWYGVPLKHATGPLCGKDTSYDVYMGLLKVASVHIFGLPCPILRNAKIEYNVMLARWLPPFYGDSGFHLTAVDQDFRSIACVRAKLGIIAASNAEPSKDLLGSNATTSVVVV